MSGKIGNRGFTLMDVAIIMLIVGLIAGPLLQKLRIDHARYLRGQTETNIDTVKRGIEDYYFDHGHYPCPADLTKSPADPDYGREVRTGTADTDPCGAAGVGALDVTGPDVDFDGPGPYVPDGVPEHMMVGGVPFATLKIPAAATLDGWSNKMTYSVSKEMAQTFINFDHGMISITGFLENPLNMGATPPDIIESDVTAFKKAQYVVLSHGEDGVGGYSAQGVLIQACPTASPTAPKERENCNNDANFFDMTESSWARNQNYNDDIMIYETSIPTRIWVNTSTPGNDIVTGVQNIGIGTATPIKDPDVKLNVAGNIRVGDGTTSRAFANTLCTSAAPPVSPAVTPNAPANCFSPLAIAGAGMGCWSGDPAMPGVKKGVMTGIENAGATANIMNFYDGAKCGNSLPGGIITTFTCPSGEAVTGINATGDVICSAL